MPGNRDLEMLRAAQEQTPAPSIVILTGRPSLATALESVRLGVVDYLTKPASVGSLCEKLDLAVHRWRVIRSIDESEQAAARVAVRLRSLKEAIAAGPGAGAVAQLPATGEPPDPLRNLTDKERGSLSRRELQVLAELAKGNPAKETAAILDLSPNTIRNHLKRIFVKLNVNSQVALLGKLAAPPRAEPLPPKP